MKDSTWFALVFISSAAILFTLNLQSLAGPTPVHAHANAARQAMRECATQAQGDLTHRVPGDGLDPFMISCMSAKGFSDRNETVE